MNLSDASLEQAKREVAAGYDYFYAKRPHLKKPNVPTRILDFRPEEAARFLALSADGSCLLLGDEKIFIHSREESNY